MKLIRNTAEGSHSVNVIPQFTSSTVISEMRADIRVAQDYSPFGVTLDGRNFVVSEKYRYGFNGMEKDDEAKGKGNSYDFGARMYDSRLGRWLSLDRLVSYYSSYSSYSYSLNNPVYYIDVEGKYVIPTDEKSKEMIVGLIERQVGSGEVAKLLTSHLGLYTDNYKISKKEFKKAIKADKLNKEQKANARDWFDAISSPESVLVNGIETDGKGGIYNGGKDAQLARDQITNSDSRIPASMIKDDNSVNVSFRPSEDMGNLSLDLIYFDDQGYSTNSFFTRDDGGDINHQTSTFDINADLVTFSLDVTPTIISTQGPGGKTIKNVRTPNNEQQNNKTLKEVDNKILKRIKHATSNNPSSVKETPTN